jgi:predicted oxidoreductase
MKQKKKEEKMSKEKMKKENDKKQYKFPMFDNEDYMKKFIGNFNAVSYDENEDIQTLKKEHNNEDVYVRDIFQTNQEISAINSAIQILGQEIDNTMDDEWVDEETKEQYEETMKHLCRLTKRGGNKNGRLLK